MNAAFIQIFHNPGMSLIPTLQKNFALLEPNDHYFVVLDGCSDDSAKIAQDYLDRVDLQATLVCTNDLHEVLALNEVLLKAREYNPRTVVHLQGDMIVEKQNFLILREFLSSKTGFGLVSLRMGGCPSAESLDFNLTEGLYGHNGGLKLLGSKLSIKEVCVVVRGPLIFSKKLLDVISWQIDPKLAPHSYDDIDLSLISLENGMINYFVQAPFRSDVTWGTTRKENRSFTESVDISHSKNKKYVFSKHSLNQSWISCPGHTQIQSLWGAKPPLYFWRGVVLNYLLTRPKANNPAVNILLRVAKKLSFMLSSREFETLNKSNQKT